MRYDADRSPNQSEGSGDHGPPDWFAAVVEPEPCQSELCQPEPELPEPELPEPELSEPELPELLRASELPSGRRRRRSALAEESQAEPPTPSERRRKSREQRPPRPEEPTDPASRARDICLRLLTGSAKTRKQLVDALRKREIPDEVAEEVLNRLTEVGLIDDAAYARAWVEERHSQRGLSRRVLAQELRTRGVAAELVEQALVQVDAEDETEAARGLVERKLRASRGLERETRIRRLVGMLARRGYSEGLAFRVVLEALSEEGEEIEQGW